MHYPEDKPHTHRLTIYNDDGSKNIISGTLLYLYQYMTILSLNGFVNFPNAISWELTYNN